MSLCLHDGKLSENAGFNKGVTAILSEIVVHLPISYSSGQNKVQVFTP